MMINGTGSSSVVPALKLENITRVFGGFTAVDDISFQVEQGEFVTLLGPSGCGKSTLLRMIGGFETPTSGQIFLDGQDITKLAPNRRNVNMVFQDYALFPHMSVIRNVAYGLRRSGVRRQEAALQAREALTLVELVDKADAMPHQLSGGQRQRVALARALVRQPKILLLDEPLSALDAKLREQMQVELKSLHEKVGTTFILVTHDQSEALSMSDRVAVMDAGRIVECDSPRKLYDQPATRYTATFVGAMNLFSSCVTDRNGMPEAALDGQPVALGSQHKGVAGEQLFGFRPDAARLVSDSARRHGQLSGHVRELRFRGAETVVLVDLGAHEVSVHLSGHQASSPPDVGQRVVLDPGRILMFEDHVE